MLWQEPCSGLGRRCFCVTDGLDGANCDEATEMVCANQCSGRGDCWLGFCRCHAGWWGHDCAHADPDVAPAAHPGSRHPCVGSAQDLGECPPLRAPHVLVMCSHRAAASAPQPSSCRCCTDSPGACSACAGESAALHQGAAGGRPSQAALHLCVRPAGHVQHAHAAVPRGQGASPPARPV